MLSLLKQMVRRFFPFPMGRSMKFEEELCPSYHPDRYLQVRIGDVMNNRYRIDGKLGYGQCSTVWLARDVRFVDPRYSASLLIYMAVKSDGSL